MKQFSLFQDIENNQKTIHEIDNAIKITLGPTGKNGILFTKKNELKFLTSGSLVLKSLEFNNKSSNVILELIKQSSIKSTIVAGDGSTTTALLTCELLKNSLKFIITGYTSIFISNGLKRLAYFSIEKAREFSNPIKTNKEILGLINTSIGKKLNPELVNIVKKALTSISRDGLILIEEHNSSESEISIVEGMEIDKGFISSYFVNDLKSFTVNFENPYILITSQTIDSLNQIREILDFIKLNNKSLVLVVEEINKEILSTLILNNIKNKIKIVVIKYSSIKFIKNGILEDLALLTHSTYCNRLVKDEKTKILTVKDLGQCEKVIVKKDKTIFFLSKFSKLIAKRRINELNRELLNSESEYEKNLFKLRIARLWGNITKLKIGNSNKYETVEQRQKIENLVNTVKSGLEEGILPGGGSFYLYLREEIGNWSYLNLIGEELFASNIMIDSLKRPFYELLANKNILKNTVAESLLRKGYPYCYDLQSKKIVNSYNEGVVDSTKSVRSILWNSLTSVSSIITSD